MSIRGTRAALLVVAMALAGCDLAVDKEGPATATVGEQFVYTIMVTNFPAIFFPPAEDPAGPIVRGAGCNGVGETQSTTLTDTLPPQVMLVSAVASQGTCTGTTTVTCQLGDIAVCASAVVTITVKAIAPGTAENRAQVAGDEDDDNPTNDADVVTTEIVAATTTTTSSTTTTTLAGAEVCGNCVDDDGDGLVDLDDPACCGAGAINARKLKLRVIPKNGLVHFVQLQGLLDTRLPGPLADDIVLQLSQPDVGTLVCARFPLEKLFNRKASHRFDDRKRTVDVAEGFQRAELAKAKGNATNVRARGRLVDLVHFPAVGAARFAVSFEDAAGPHCAAGSFTFKQARKKSLRAP
jgi:hypothetical protein